MFVLICHVDDVDDVYGEEELQQCNNTKKTSMGILVPSGFL